MPTPVERVLDALGAAGCGPRRSGHGWSARCPAHEDRNPSLSIRQGDGDRVLLHCHAGCHTETVVAAIGLEMADLSPPRPDKASANGEAGATYDYTDETGTVIFQVVRRPGKRFFQRRPDGRGGWVNGLGPGTRRPLYHMPEVIQAVSGGQRIFVVEGEKDADAIRREGEVATCNPMGAGKWQRGHADTLRGARQVVIVADKDKPGRAHANAVAGTLAGRVEQVMIVEALAGKDVSDHLAAGHRLDELEVVYGSAAPRDKQSSGATDDFDPATIPTLGPRLLHRPASTIEVVPPTWLWKHWLVAGALHLMVGRQGAGKSTFAAWVVAQCSTGRAWPGEDEARTPMRCAMLSLEEPGGERLTARLVAAGADLDAVEILGDVEDHDDDGRPIRRPWRLPGDCGVLEAAITETGVRVVTIDGLGHSIKGDSHNYAVVGAALTALAGVAERTGCTILGLTHPPKGNSEAVTSAIGSTAWTALARIIWVLGLDPTDERSNDDSDHRRVVRVAPGSNYKLPDQGLAFRCVEHDETEAGYVTALQLSDVAADAITNPPLPVDSDDTEDACSVLASILTPGDLRVKHAQDAMAEAGFTIKQTRRAKEALKVRSVKHGKPGDAEQGWKWELPQSRRCQEGAEDALPPEGAPWPPSGHLRLEYSEEET